MAKRKLKKVGDRISILFNQGDEDLVEWINRNPDNINETVKAAWRSGIQQGTISIGSGQPEALPASVIETEKLAAEIVAKMRAEGLLTPSALPSHSQEDNNQMADIHEKLDDIYRNVKVVTEDFKYTDQYLTQIAQAFEQVQGAVFEIYRRTANIDSGNGETNEIPIEILKELQEIKNLLNKINPSLSFPPIRKRELDFPKMDEKKKNPEVANMMHRAIGKLIDE